MYRSRRLVRHLHPRRRSPCLWSNGCPTWPSACLGSRHGIGWICRRCARRPLLRGLWAGIPHGRSYASTDCGRQAAPLLGKRLIDMDEGYVIGDWTAAAPALNSSAVCPNGEVQHVQPLDQHQCADARPPARRGGSLAADAASGFEGLGVRAPAVAVRYLRLLWRRVSLRHLGDDASRRGRGLLLTGLAIDKAGWHEFLVYALNLQAAVKISVPLQAR